MFSSTREGRTPPCNRRTADSKRLAGWLKEASILCSGSSMGVLCGVR